MDNEVCNYSFSADAKVNLSLPGLATSGRDVSVTGATVSIDFPHGKTSDPKKMSFDWSDSANPKKVTIADGKIEVSVSALNFTGEKNTGGTFEFSGTANVGFLVKEDIKLMPDGSILLRQNSKGNLTITYDKSGSISSTFDTDSLNVIVDMVKPQDSGTPKILARFTAAGSQDVKNAIAGNFKVYPTDDIDVGNIKFKLNSFNCDGVLHLDTLKMDIKDGTFAATITFPDDKASVNYVTGKAKIEGDYKQGTGYTGKVTIAKASALKFAGGSLYGDIEGKFTDALALVYVKSSNFYLQHSDLGQQEIKVRNFRYTNQGLETMDIDKAKIVYLKKAVIRIDQATWTMSTGILAMNQAYVEFGDEKIVLNVKGFRLNASTAEINLDSFDGKADFSPNLYATMAGAINENAFTASVSVTVLKVGASGRIDLGIKDENGESYNYGLVDLSATLGSGVPLGQLPIKLTRLAAKGGYNESYTLSSNTWTPANGSFVFGGGLGLCDTTNLIKLDSDVTFQLNNSSAELSMKGNMAVPATGSAYVTGSVDANYQLGSGMIDGSLNSTFRFPANGPLVKIDSGTILFMFSSTSIELGNQTPATGTLLNVYTFTGSMSVSANPNNLSSLSGSAEVSFNDFGGVNYRYPADFNPATLEPTDFWGFGFAVNFAYHFQTDATIALSNGDCSFSSSSTFSGDAEGTIKWPSLFGGSATTFSANIYCGNASIKKEAGQPTVTLTGKIEFSFNDYSGSASVTNMPLN